MHAAAITCAGLFQIELAATYTINGASLSTEDKSYACSCYHMQTVPNEVQSSTQTCSKCNMPNIGVRESLQICALHHNKSTVAAITCLQ